MSYIGRGQVLLNSGRLLTLEDASVKEKAELILMENLKLDNETCHKAWGCMPYNWIQIVKKKQNASGRGRVAQWRGCASPIKKLGKAGLKEFH